MAKHWQLDQRQWLRALGLIPEGVSPNHGWRHRFKTLALEAGLDPRVVDAIQGHTGRTASDGYGDVTLRAKKAAIDKLESGQGNKAAMLDAKVAFPVIEPWLADIGGATVRLVSHRIC